MRHRQLSTCHLNVFGSRHVFLYVTQLALALSLHVLWAAAPNGQNAEAARILHGMEERYNRVKTLQVQFTESYTAQGHARRQESGTLTLRKPGRMRWDYTAPAGKLFLSDGNYVFLYSPDTKQVEKMRLKESEDMRAPLAFLLGRLDFQKEFRDFAVKDQGGSYIVTATPKSDRLPYNKVEMLVGSDFEIRHLVISGQDNSVLSFNFEAEKMNPTVNDDRFRFQMPAGATWADAAMR